MMGNSVIGTSVHPRLCPVFIIGGASGVGKTRMALELAKEFRDRPEFGCEVQFLSLEIKSNGGWSAGSKSHAEHQDALKDNEKKLVAMLLNSGFKKNPVVHPTVDLSHLLPTMFDLNSNNAKVLVLNIDECHRDIEVCTEIIRVVREFNSGSRSMVKIIPICTGLWLDEDRVQKIRDVSETSPVYIGLHFLPEEQVPRLVQNVVSAYPKEIHRDDDGKEKTDNHVIGDHMLSNPDAKAILEDTRGWARAVVSLGFIIASSMVQHGTKLDWSNIEERYLEYIQSQYRVDYEKLIGGLKYVEKLVWIALAPHPVRKEGDHTILKSKV